MGLRLLLGDAARPEGELSLASWQGLLEACPWATPYDSPAVVGAWYAAFGAKYEPVVVCETGPDGELVGLLALAQDRRCGQLVPAVHRIASVQGWLARPLRGSYFLERALVALFERFPGQNLEFRALPEGAPTDWARPGRSVGRHARLSPVHRRFVAFDPERAAKKLDKRAESQQLAGLKKRGELRFEPALDAKTLQGILPELARWFDRHAVDAGRAARFSEHSYELDFWAGLPAQSPRCMASVLWVQGEPAAATVGLSSDTRFHLVWGVDNPAFETLAPSQVLWLMLEEHLLGQGVVDSDITSGLDWMHLGAAEVRPTLGVNLLFDPRARLAHDANRAAVGLSRWALALIDR